MAVDGEDNCRTHAQGSEPALQSTQFAQINVACSSSAEYGDLFPFDEQWPRNLICERRWLLSPGKTGFNNIKLLIERGRVL